MFPIIGLECLDREGSSGKLDKSEEMECRGLRATRESRVRGEVGGELRNDNQFRNERSRRRAGMARYVLLPVLRFAHKTGRQMARLLIVDSIPDSILPLLSL